jgi:isopentenyldiphosphate isomerase
VGVTFEKKSKEYVDGKHRFFCQWYYICLDSDISKFFIQKEEVADLQWIDKQSLIDEIEHIPEKYVGYMKRCPFLP